MIFSVEELRFRINNSKLLKGFVVTIMGSGASKVILVLATFVCSNLLGKMEFGELSFVRNTLNMILCICALNFSALCTKFTAEAKTSLASLHRLFLLFVFSILICFIIGLLLIVTPKEYLIFLLSTETVVCFFKIVGVLLPLFILQPLVEGVLRGVKKFKLIGILQTVSSVFYLVAVFIGIELGGINGAMVGVIMYYALYSIVSICILEQKFHISNYIYKLRRFWNQKNTIYKMILPLFLMSFVDAPVMWVAQVILSKSGSMESVGSMTALMQIRNLAMLIPSYFSNTYIAFAGDMNSQKRYADYYRQFQRIVRLYMMIGLGMFVFFSIFSRPILFLYGCDFVEDWPAMIISNIGIPLTLLIGLFRIDLLLKDHQQYLLIITLIWNAVWLVSLYGLNLIGMHPLYSFFVSQNIGATVFILGLIVVYNKDRKIFLK